MLKKIVLSTFVGLVLSASVAYARADEMSWEVKNGTHMQCKLRDGMTLRRGADFVETKHLRCTKDNHLVIDMTVACGPEGSLTRYQLKHGGRVKVTCKQMQFASAK